MRDSASRAPRGGGNRARRLRRGGPIAAVAAAVAIAAAACSALPGSPGGSVKYQEALAFARCMRAHGVPGFPDPSVQSNGSGVAVTIRMKAGSGGIDPHSPQFQAAQQVCRSILPKPGKNASGNAPSGSGG